jgi:hypothetical protein
MNLRPLLEKELLSNSESKQIVEAINEWEEIAGYHMEFGEQCICGKENIKYCFEIRNVKNGKTLYPIGSKCIENFGNETLLEQMKIYEYKYHIFHNKDKKHDGKTYDWICKNAVDYIKFLIGSNTTKKKYQNLITYYLTTTKCVKFIPPINVSSSDSDNDDNTICQKCQSNKPNNQYKLCYNCNMTNKKNKCMECDAPTNYKLCYKCYKKII